MRVHNGRAAEVGVTIKGTLETFNLPDLLQMLAFNQKVGTLVLDTAGGPRTLYVESGALGFVQGDPHPTRALGRILRRNEALPADRLQRGVSIAAKSGRYLGDALADLGVLEGDRRTAATLEAVAELFFDLLQTPITRFEFVEGKRIAPDGSEGAAIEPLAAVDGLLLELTRKLDEWAVVRGEVPSDEEVYERTAVHPDLRGEDPTTLPASTVERVLPLLDGTRTVAAVVDESDGDRFSVTKLVAALLRQGAVRAVPTAELVERGEQRLRHDRPLDAAALLRRAVHRGDAPASVRTRLAAALAASGDGVGAAAELETYATACETTDPVGTFDALLRALELRGGDLAVAARLCDHYLRNGERLRGRSKDAATALRRLVEGATAAGRPLEAATRLALFVERGEAPAEDLLVLADLWAAAGRRGEAAQALVRRADGLLHAGHATPARDLLRRALGYDPTRADVRRRLTELEEADARRRHRRRLVVLGCLLGLTVASAGAVYLVHDGRAARAAEATLSAAEDATKRSEGLAADAASSFRTAVDTASAGDVPAGTVGTAVATLRKAASEAATSLRAALGSAEEELSAVVGPRAGSAREHLASLEARRKAILARADFAVREVGERAQTAVEQGERAYRDGRFREARALLSRAVRLSFDDPSRVARAQRSLAQVDAYLTGVERARTEFEAAVEKGRTDEAWRLGCRMLATYLDSDVTREILLPVPVETKPRGASLRVGATGVVVAAPAVLRYSPFGDLDLAVRAPASVPQTVKLPSFDAIREAEARGGLAPTRVNVTLAAGPRWTAKTPVSAGPFAIGETAWVAGDDGTSVALLRPADGSASAVSLARALPDRLRAAGRGAGGTWMLVGLRSYVQDPDTAHGWQYQTSGLLERAPAFADGLVVLADDTGVLHGLDASNGEPRWKGSLSAGPAQAPFASPLGFVLATAAGDVVAVEPRTGAVTTLVPGEARRPALVAPFGAGVVVVGGPGEGLSLIRPDRSVAPIGSAACDPAVGIVAAAGTVVWADPSGAVFALRHGENRPVEVSGLGAVVKAPTLADGTLYGVGKDGALRAARLAEPTRTVWRVALGSPAEASPVAAGDLVFVRTAAGVAAYER